MIQEIHCQISYSPCSIEKNRPAGPLAAPHFRRHRPSGMGNHSQTDSSSESLFDRLPEPGVHPTAHGFRKLEKSLLTDRRHIGRSVSINFNFAALLGLSIHQLNQMHLQGFVLMFLYQLTMASTIKKFTANRLYSPAKLLVSHNSCITNPKG